MKPSVPEQKRSEHIQALDQTLETVLHHLCNLPEVVKVILFGSYAQGRRDIQIVSLVASLQRYTLKKLLMER